MSLPERARDLNLSPLEMLVMGDLMNGLSPKEAAERNGISASMIGHWMSSRKGTPFRAAYDEMRRLRREIIEAKFEAASEQIADRMVALALDGEVEGKSGAISKLRLAAQESVLDRAGFPRVTKTIVGDQDIDEAIEIELALLRQAEDDDAGSEITAALEAAFGELEEDRGDLEPSGLDPAAQAT